MPLLVAASLLFAAAPQVAPPPAPQNPTAPQARDYGEAQGASLAALMVAQACEGGHVTVKGRIDLLERGRYWLLVDGGSRALLLPSFALTGPELDRMVGTWSEVRGICRALRPRESVGGADEDTPAFPDLPPLPAPRADRPTISITAFSASDAGGPGRETAAAESAIIRTVLNDPAGFVGVSVRIVGLFRGRNLFGDLPAGSERGGADWVLKEGDAAVWVIGKPPRGKGWSLDPQYKGDTVRWLAVEGPIEVVGGIAYLRASKVALVRDPRSEAAESR
jgi:hypothetical protein